MALQVWLPLNGNLNNQGLTDITVTNSGATVDNNGKIGKCLSFNGTSSVLHCDDIGLDTSKDYTLACWFYLNAIPTGSNARLIQISVSTDTAFSNMSTGIVVDYLNSGSQGKFALVDGGSYTYYNYNFLVNTWYHVTYTKQGDTKKLYLNGELLTTLTFGGSSRSPKHFYVGGTEAANRMLNGKMNDVRIYDHALSAKEVEVLSRGLVCHYPLNGGGRGRDNLLLKTNQGKTYWTWSAASGSRTVETYETTGVKMTVVEVGSSWNMWYYSGLVPSDIEPDTDYTVSVDILPPQNATIKCSIMQTNATNIICPTSDCTVTANVWNHAVFKLHSNSSFTPSGQVIYMNGIAPDTVGKTIYLKNIKLEKGEVATPWMPNSADTAYTAMGYNSTTEYDVSGYGNNGTKNGTITYDSNTARYSVCSSFNGTNAYIESDPLPTETATIACWLKTTWTSSSGYRLAVHDKNSGLAIGWSGTRLITYIGSSAGSTGSMIETDGKWTANTWHHVTVVKTGSTTRDVYIDGVKMATGGGNWWGGDLNKLNIGNRHVSGSYSAYWDGQISDFRAYATALSATQVAELYNTAVSVANNGTLLGYELVEG